MAPRLMGGTPMLRKPHGPPPYSDHTPLGWSRLNVSAPDRPTSLSRPRVVCCGPGTNHRKMTETGKEWICSLTAISQSFL
jgi:hypothetical protein